MSLCFQLHPASCPPANRHGFAPPYSRSIPDFVCPESREIPYVSSSVLRTTHGFMEDFIMAGQHFQERPDFPARCRLSNIRLRNAAILCAMQFGCASTPEVAKPQAVTAGPWTPDVTSQSTFNQCVSLGPFLSSQISLLDAVGATGDPAHADW